jgi:hypothetical protein
MAVTVNEAGTPFVSDVTGALVALFHPQPPEPSAPFPPSGGASTQRVGMHSLQLSTGSAVELDEVEGDAGLAAKAVPIPPPTTSRPTAAAAVPWRRKDPPKLENFMSHSFRLTCAQDDFLLRRGG